MNTHKKLSVQFDFPEGLTIENDIPLSERQFLIEDFGIVTSNNVYLKTYATKEIPSFAHPWQKLLINEFTVYQFSLSGGKSNHKITRIK